MFMPRMTALAELLWTNKSQDYPSYLDRLQRQYRRLDELQVHYRLPDLPGIITENVFVDADTLTVKKPLADMRIFYTTDGSLPRTSANELKTPLIIKRSALIKLAAFTPNGLTRGYLYAALPKAGLCRCVARGWRPTGIESANIIRLFLSRRA
jgi:hexosaminidase